MGREFDMPNGFRVQEHPAHAPDFPGEPYVHYKVYEPIVRNGRVHWQLKVMFKAGDEVPSWLY